MAGFCTADRVPATRATNFYSLPAIRRNRQRWSGRRLAHGLRPPVRVFVPVPGVDAGFHQLYCRHFASGGSKSAGALQCVASNFPPRENSRACATALNFLVDFDGGVKWRPRTKRYGFEAGYKFLHISNAFTTSVDPGVDNNLYLCFSLYA